MQVNSVNENNTNNLSASLNSSIANNHLEQRTREAALPPLNPSSETNPASNSSRPNLIKGTFTIDLILINICDRHFSITIPNVSIDMVKYEKIKSFLKSDAMRDPDHVAKFVEEESSTYSLADLSGLKYSALMALKKNDRDHFYFYLALMNKINPTSPITLSTTAYGAVLLALSNPSKIREARATVNLARHGLPEANDLKILSYGLRKLESPAEAVIECLHLIQAKVLESYNELTQIIRSNLHRSDFRLTFLELLKNDLNHFIEEPRLHRFCMTMVNEVLAVTLYYDKKFEEVEFLITKQTRLMERLTQPTFEVGVLALLKRGKLQEAEKFLIHITEKKQLLTSYISYLKNDEKKAIANLTAALQRSSHIEHVITYTEVCSIVPKDQIIPTPDIIKCFEYILQIDADSVMAMQFLLEAYIKLYDGKNDLKNRLLKIICAFRTAEPILSLVYEQQIYQLSLKHKELKKSLPVDYAEELYRRYKESKLEDPQFVINFAKSLQNAGKFEQALLLYQDLHRVKDDDDTIVLLTNLLRKLNRFEEAETYIKKFLENHPASAAAHFLLANHFQMTRRHNEALEHATRGSEIDPSRQDLKFLKASILFYLKEYAQSIKQIERINKTRRDEALFSLCVPNLFTCYVELGLFSKAGRLLEQYPLLIPQDMLKRYEQEVLLQQKKSETLQSEVKAIDLSSEIENKARDLPSVLTVIPANSAPAKAEPVRNIIKQGPTHLQSFSKHAVGSLNPNDRIQAWIQNPSLLREVCTIDTTIYPNTKPAATSTIETVEVIIAKKLNPYEAKCLDQARQHLGAIGRWILHKEQYDSSEQTSAVHYLLPRTLVYHVLKFGEALTPTGRNQKLLTEVFEQTIQTHILSTKLLQYLRHIARHSFVTIDMNKLINFCTELEKTTVLHNIVAYSEGKLNKQEKLVVNFAHRTNLPVEQTLTKEIPADYLEAALFELNEMHRIAHKIGILDIDQSPLYKNGIKLAICAVEECLKRLNIRHRELDDFFYFGNKVAHEMSEDPKDYVNEDIPLGRLDSIIKRKDRIIELIKTTPKKQH